MGEATPTRRGAPGQAPGPDKQSGVPRAWQRGAIYSAAALWPGGDWRTRAAPVPRYAGRHRLQPFSVGRVAINAFATRTLSTPNPLCRCPGGPYWSRGLGQAGVNWVRQHPPAAGPRARLQGRTSNLEFQGHGRGGPSTRLLHCGRAGTGVHGPRQSHGMRADIGCNRSVWAGWRLMPLPPEHCRLPIHCADARVAPTGVADLGRRGLIG